MSEHARYAMLIEWSKLDDAYVVSFPEWERAGMLANTHGATYTEAAQRGEEMLAALIAGAQATDEPLPTPAFFDDLAYAHGETVEDIARENDTLASELESRADASA